MRVMGIDPGRTTGLAVIDEGDRLTPYMRSCVLKQVEFFQLWRVVGYEINHLHPDLVAIETGFSRGRLAADHLAEYRGIIKAACQLLGIPFVERQVNWVRNRLLGYSRCKEGNIKDMVVAELQRRNISPPMKGRKPDYDAADALALALAVLQEQGEEPCAT